MTDLIKREDVLKIDKITGDLNWEIKSSSKKTCAKGEKK